MVVRKKRIRRKRISRKGVKPLTVLGVVLVILGLFLLVRYSLSPPMRFVIKGIDVSAHSGTICWEEVSRSKVDFVFIKATEGCTMVDRQFRANVQGAVAAGIPVGAYHFFNFNSDGAQQARHFWKTVKTSRLSLPLVVDFEEYGNNIRTPGKTITENLRRFVRTINSLSGSEVMIYTNEDCYRSYIRGNFGSPMIWIASFRFIPTVDCHWIFWQYSHRGKFDGIPGWVDLNVFRGSTVEWERFVSQRGDPPK